MKKLFSLLIMAVAVLSLSAGDRKTVAILGDSYSTFHNYVTPDTNYVWYKLPVLTVNTDVSEVTQTWWHKFISENGYKLGVNNSFSGSTICYRGYRGEDYKDRSFITRAAYLGNPDIIFIFGATNDSWAGVPIGEYVYSDWTDEQLYSFRPGMACLLKNIKERYPNVDIYFIMNDGLSDAINESIRTLCGYYSVPLIELEGISKQAGHPDVKGMSQIASQIAAYLDSRK
ncbi:SGNH/GDSL hydrolase family protein [Muribaculum sp.]|uniref:SGNH/GDSL hydrolase family protein n=1 Tax=Muribaculum sp. TaxID=1918611 RepID=UPI0023BB414C|nr:SGNH/GDSL hydrolase family protein [Muribaculum sp.]MDE5706216.1 SGNH/GDSL hydrolase family protein [Muribaculum sp.]